MAYLDQLERAEAMASSQLLAIRDTLGRATTSLDTQQGAQAEALALQNHASDVRAMTLEGRDAVRANALADTLDAVAEALL